MLTVSDVYCGYGKNDVVKNVSFSVEKSVRLCIVGPNGCGKTTLLKSLAGLLAYKGSISCDGQEIGKLRRKELARKIGFMTQTSNAYFPYSVFDIVSFGRYAALKNPLGTLSKEDRDIVLDAINDVGLSDRKDDLITTLSGGQFQRAFLARAFAQDPDILLLDEPTNHLDIKYQYELLELLDKWSAARGKTIILVMHDLTLASAFCETALLLCDGKQTFWGPMELLKKSDCLNAAFGINVRQTMISALEQWVYSNSIIH